jgi:hypothetical protein
MQARRASRELALILFSQFEKEITHYSRKDFENIMLKSVRILSNSASEDLKLTVGSLIDIKSSLDDYEAEHELNLSRPIGVKNKPVQIPMTDEMIAKVDTMLDVAEKAILEQLDAIKSGDITSEELESAKKSLKNGYMQIYDSAESMETWAFFRSLCGVSTTPMKECEKTESATKEEIMEIAKRFKLDTVYFLKGKENANG